MQTLEQQDAQNCFNLIPDDVRQDLKLISGEIETIPDEDPDVEEEQDGDHVWLKVSRTDGREFKLRVNITGEGNVLDPLKGGGEAGGEAPNWAFGNRAHSEKAAKAGPDKKAFRCKNCGFLETSAQAGENATPHACPGCGCGVKFDPQTGEKSPVPKNWEILANCGADRLAELGLEPAQVHKHRPTRKSGVPAKPKNISVTTSESPAAAGKTKSSKR